MKRLPESFEFEGSERHASPKKGKRTNKKNDAKLNRQSGQGYFSIKTKKTVPPGMMRKESAQHKNKEDRPTWNDEKRKCWD